MLSSSFYQYFTQYSFQATGCFPCGDRGINPVATIVINYLREYWLNWKSNQQPAVSKSCVLLTKLRGFGYCTFVIHNRKQVITELSIYEFQFVSNKHLNFEVKWSLDMQKLYRKEKFSTKVIMNGLLKLIWVNSYSNYIKSFFQIVQSSLIFLSCMVFNTIFNIVSVVSS